MFNALITFFQHFKAWSERYDSPPPTAAEFPPHEGQNALFWTCPICGLQMTEGIFDRHFNAHAVTTFGGFINTLDIPLDDTQPLFERTPDGE